MNINSDQQYQQFRKEFLNLKNRGNLTGQDQQRFNELQTAVTQWEASPNFHGDRVGTKSGGDQGTTKGGGIGDQGSGSAPIRS
jgi:hypothetical protein